MPTGRKRGYKRARTKSTNQSELLVNSRRKKIKKEQHQRVTEESLKTFSIAGLRKFIVAHGKQPKGTTKKPILAMALHCLKESEQTLIPLEQHDVETCTLFQETLQYNTDVTIIGNNFRIPVHGALIAQQSPSLCALLKLNNPGSLKKVYYLDSTVPLKAAVEFFKHFYRGLTPNVTAKDFEVKEIVGYGALIDMHLDSAKEAFQETLCTYINDVRKDTYPDGFKYDAYRQLDRERKDELGYLFSLAIHYKITHKHSLFTFLRHEFERTQNDLCFSKVKYVLSLINNENRPVFGDNLTTWLLSYATHQKMEWESLKHYFATPTFESLSYLLLWVASTKGNQGWRAEKRRDRCELFVDACASYLDPGMHPPPGN